MRLLISDIVEVVGAEVRGGDAAVSGAAGGAMGGWVGGGWLEPEGGIGDAKHVFAFTGGDVDGGGGQ